MKRNSGMQEKAERLEKAYSQPLVDPFSLDTAAIIHRCLSENKEKINATISAFCLVQKELKRLELSYCSSSMEMSALIHRVSEVNRDLGKIKAEMKRLESDRIKLGGEL